MSFIKELPKIELHAHLNGSFTNEIIAELVRLKNDKDVGNEYQNSSYQFTLDEIAGMNNCFKKFQFIQSLTDTPEALALATRRVIEVFSKDNVIYLELRTTPKETKCMTKMDYLQTVIQSILECQDRIPSIIVKLLPSIDRSKSVESAIDTINLSLLMQSKYPDIIKGIDFSGLPHVGEFREFKPFLINVRNSGLKLAIHCGEIDDRDDESMEMITCMDRLGHGTFIKGEARTLLLTKRIPVECCLTSNIKTDTVKTYSDSHFKGLLDVGHPVVICTDDSGVFDTTLSTELEICQSTFNLSNEDIVKLTRTAIDCSFANCSEQVKLHEKIDDYIKRFDMKI